MEEFTHVTYRDPELSSVQLGLNWIEIKFMLHEWGPELALRAILAFVWEDVPFVDATEE